MDLEGTKPKRHDRLVGKKALRNTGLFKDAMNAAHYTQWLKTRCLKFMILFLRSLIHSQKCVNIQAKATVIGPGFFKV
jgi:serine acetyltransferase